MLDGSQPCYHVTLIPWTMSPIYVHKFPYLQKRIPDTSICAGFAPLSCKLAQVEALVWTRIKLTLHGVFQSRTADKVSKQMPRNLWLQMQRFLLDVGCTFLQPFVRSSVPLCCQKFMANNIFAWQKTHTAHSKWQTTCSESQARHLNKPMSGGECWQFSRGVFRGSVQGSFRGSFQGRGTVLGRNLYALCEQPPPPVNANPNRAVCASELFGVYLFSQVVCVLNTL